MAANSAVEWGSIVKPILAASYGSFNKNDIMELAKAIIKSEAELLNHEEKYETFYTTFSALAADYISSSASAVCRSQIGVVCGACRILLVYLLSKLPSNGKSELQLQQVMLSTKQLLLPIKALCTAKSMLSKSDQLVLTAIMKNAKLPPHIKTSMPGEGKESSSSGGSSGGGGGSSGGKTRSRSDLSSVILEQLTHALVDSVPPSRVPASPTTPASVSAAAVTTSATTPVGMTSTPQLADKPSPTAQPSSETNSHIESVFSQRNIGSLKSLGAGDVLLDMCLQLPHLARYIHMYHLAVSKKGFSLPSNLAEAHVVHHSLQALVGDLSTVMSALSLPILEPLTQQRLDKLTTLTMTCLYIAISASTAASVAAISTVSSKPQPASANQSGGNKPSEDEVNIETLATSVVEKSLEIFNLIYDVIKSSTRTGGYVVQNYTLLGAWVLVSGLQAHLSASSQATDKPNKEDKGKSPSKSRDSRVNLMKVQQGFSVVGVALCREALRLVAALLDDVQYEDCSQTPAPSPLDIQQFSLLSMATPLQRAVTILFALPFNQFLFYIATVSYRKACTLKRIQKHPPEGDNFSTSESTIYYDEDEMSLESSPDPADEDSEPLLGLWFEETISVPENDGNQNQAENKSGQSSAAQPSQANNNQSSTSSLVPDKAEPNGYIMLATQIFRLMNKYLVTSESSYLTKYIESGLTEQQMVMLAAIIRDLDRETARTDTGTISACFGATLGQLYCEFSQALTQYTHNLLARSLLSESLQVTLLVHLGVSPNPSPPESSAWPLQVYPRTLAVLAQVLLLKSQAEKESACINIWTRLINTLVDSVCSNQTSSDVDNEDVNVEHAQLVLFLFHSLNLMQKKSVLLSVATGVIKVSERGHSSLKESHLKESQLLHLSRILLFLDYLVKHLYDPPPALLEQVQWNLLSGTSLLSDEGGAARIFCPWNKIENNYRKLMPLDEFSIRPKFYSLTYGEYNNQEPPKLDGLACNFLLGTAEKVKYPVLIDSLIEIMGVCEQCTPGVRPQDKMTPTSICAIQYTFTITWRLLLQLPPSTPYLERLALGGRVEPTPVLLYSLIWGPRSSHRIFIPWIKDCLVKQGMYTQYAEVALKNVSDFVNSPNYDINLVRNTITALMPRVDSKATSLQQNTKDKKGWAVSANDLPSVMDLCLLDTVIAKVQSISEVQHKSNAQSNIQTLFSSDSEANKTMQTIDTTQQLDICQELLPLILRLTEVTLACTRSSLLYQVCETNDTGTAYTVGDLSVFRSVLAISSSRCNKTQSLSSQLLPLFPAAVTAVLNKWNSTSINSLPWSEFANDILPGESYIMCVVITLASFLSANFPFTINPSLKHLLHSLINFICQNLPKNGESALWQQVVSVLTPFTLDACTDSNDCNTIEKALGDADSEKQQAVVYSLVLEHIYSIIINYTAPSLPCSDAVNEKVVLVCISWLEGLLDKSSGVQALEKFFDQPDRDLVNILLSISSPRTYSSSEYGIKVLHFFNKLFTAAEKGGADSGRLEKLCSSVLRLASVDASQLSSWLDHVILGPGSRIPPAASAPPPAADPPPPIVTLGISSSSGSTNESKESKSDKGSSSGAVVGSVQSSASICTTGTGAASTAASTKEKESKSLFQENQLLLQHLTSYIVKQTNGSEVKENVALNLLEALVPMGSQLLLQGQGSGFPQLMTVMASLADAGTGSGHITLFSAVPMWIQICLKQVSEVNFAEEEEKKDKGLECGWALLSYVGEVMRALGPSPPRAPSPCPPDLPPHSEPPDWADDLTPTTTSTAQPDDDSTADESDEDSLCNKLCTFTITQKEFMNQHWYHCHTCKMVDGVGVCSICAKVCHKGHDVTYAKFGNFFCDCGARENGACQALVKRNASNGGQTADGVGVSGGISSSSASMDPPPPSLRRRPSSPNLNEHRLQNQHRHATLAKLLEPMAEVLISLVRKEQNLIGPLIALLKHLVPAVEASAKRTSPVGCHRRTQQALEALHYQEKKFLHTDQLMVPTLGSQEGAFENVRMNYSGEQGQTIRQLVSAHMIRRVAMCCLASPHGKRQHLAVSHEKGKITILQLSALLKQADSSKRKLTLTRLSSAPIPFTVLSIAGNPLNEDFLAVCGLKDCHVVTFTSSGSVADHIVLQPQLETGNFIIRAVWLPGSQTSLALVTADFVKIYDFAVDTLSPQYYFLVPTGKIRDVSFVCSQEKSTMLLMSSTGYIYVQDMNEESSARHGPFYITSTLEIYHPEIKDLNGQVCGGGVSVYYSHTLKLMFFSYSQGKNFIAPLKGADTTVSPVFQIQTNSGRSGSSNKPASANSSSQPLCQWTEVPNHPGLICAMLQASNNPVILMLKPDSIVVQEIKVMPAKAKIMDMVAIRHASSSTAEQRTTLILLCEDGSLRIYMASMDQTGFWLSPSMRPASSSAPHKVSKKKKTVKTGKPPGTVSFPVDFFEHCTAMNDVDFGGNDLLQVYNAQQIKHRLNTTGMYIASTKTAGFSIEISNNDPLHVITGVRIFVGNQDIQRVPAFLELGGRSIPTTCTRNRWFDFPLTREESLAADKKLTLTFGPSQDAEGVTMVDSIKVYGKTKDMFGWPEETEEVASSTNNTSQAITTNPSNPELDSTTTTTSNISLLDKMVSSMLEVLDGCYAVGASSNVVLISTAVLLATQLLTTPTASCIQLQAKSLLAALHPTSPSPSPSPSQPYPHHSYRDQAIITYVMNSLASLKEVTNPADLDTEAFFRLLQMTRAIAISRPSNLVKFSQQTESDEAKPHLITQMVEIMWRLHGAQPVNPALSSVCVPGLKHVEVTVCSLVEIVHAFMITEGTDAIVELACQVYLELLLCKDTAVSFSAKSAIIRALRPRTKRRRVYIPSPPPPPPHTVTQGTSETEKGGVSGGPISQPSQDSSEAEPNHFDDTVEPMVLLAPDVAAGGGSVDALLGGGGLPPMLDIPPDADDETMVELAIALSLQDHDAPPNLQSLVNIQALQNLAGPALQALHGTGSQVVGGSQEGGHLSDTTASAGGSDDEGSTAATDGSTLRTSPADQVGGSGGSESGGSGVESMTGGENVSGRSSAYGDAGSSEAREQAPAPQDTQPCFEPVAPDASTLHSLRLATLEKFVTSLHRLTDVGGVTAIPFMQVVLMLTSDLDGEEERGRACLESLLLCLLSILSVSNLENITQRTPHREVQLVIMRLLSVLMSRPKSSSKTDNSTFVCQTTANLLIQSGLVDHCLTLLKELIPYWKNNQEEEASRDASQGAVLKPHLPSSPPDMSPFFLRQYVKGHATDVFEAYPQLLTEMALRLPYQVEKHASILYDFPQGWYYYLCEYMMTQQTPFVRRQVRKLLLFICDTKEKYRLLRDLHSLESHMMSAKNYVEESKHGSLSYDSLVELTEHLKSCVEVASGRVANWRHFCVKDASILAFLVESSCGLEEPVAQITLQLLQSALCLPQPQTQTQSSAASQQQAVQESTATTTSTTTTTTTTTTAGTTSSSSKGRSSRSGSKEKAEESGSGGSTEADEAQCSALVRQLTSSVSPQQLTHFMKTFLLETNATNMRWQAHALILSIYKNSEAKDQEALLDQLWSLWLQLPSYGRKAAQYVDLLGYFSIKSNVSSHKMTEYIEKAMYMLRVQNYMLSLHPNTTLYSQLAEYVELDGYFLESDPCLVCNNPELPMSNIKLSSIKIDSKFTTTTQIVKLVSSHTISKITLRITDLKRAKMVRTMNIYYNNRSVQAVVELKNKPAMWHKAKKVSLSSGQTEVKVEFPLPIVACNLMIEYADFYENLQASSETLQCPRCSSSVPANPGVCANCGENVFQCHKCRAINYDEKDPFLCHACGFCKYAKFDFTLTGRACCAVDPIENDEDRKKTVASINSYLEKADRVYKQLLGHKPTLEMLLLKIGEHKNERRTEEGTSGSSSTTNNSNNTTSNNSTMVNRHIQLLAQRYCTDCKTSFDDLSRIIQKVLACRKKLMEYDRTELAASEGHIAETVREEPETEPEALFSKCYGCCSATTEHCLVLLRALAVNPTSRSTFAKIGLVHELMENNLRRGMPQIQEEVRGLICVIVGDNPDATNEICCLIMNRIRMTLCGHLASPELAAAVRPEMNLLAALVNKEDSCWELKLRCVMHLFLVSCSGGHVSPVVLESITLPCLNIFQRLIKPEPPGSKKNKDKVTEDVATVRPSSGIFVDIGSWLMGKREHSFRSWRKRMPKKRVSSASSASCSTLVSATSSATGDPQPSTSANPPSTDQPQQQVPTRSKKENREYFLQEKFARKWREKSVILLDLAKTSWIKNVLFNPSSRLARQVTCNIIESLCQEPNRKKQLVNLLTGFLNEVSGESSAEFLELFENLIKEPPWKEYLALRGVLLNIAKLISTEIEYLHKLEKTTLTSDLSQGYTLKSLTELMTSFLEREGIRQAYKGCLVSTVLSGYLSLRTLVVQRTRLIDITQDMLLEILEDITTGTEAETKAFMAICIQTVEKCSPQDVRTPVFVFERLCSIIYPEENDVGEFYLTLDKDPQQEDFLQGRMLGNPYSSVEPGMGPLMRDVKNKICLDCELVALLEDDNGMELLVNNKIISLDLPVKEVYKKIWVAEGGEGDSMRVVYRMRGLLGDATEEFVETLQNKSQQEVNNEELYKMANVVAECSGLQVIINRLGQIKEVTRSRQLLQVTLKLLSLCVKVKGNQEMLSRADMGAVSVLLNTLQLCLPDSNNAHLTEQILQITETIMSAATAKSTEDYTVFSRSLGGPDQVKSLLELASSSTSVRSSPAILRNMTRVLAALTYANHRKMAVLMDHFKPALDFTKFDTHHAPEDEQKLEFFCHLTTGIDCSSLGNTLKDYILTLGIVEQSLQYITTRAPSVKSILMHTDTEEWKEFISKPSLKYILRFLAGIASHHKATQDAVSLDCISIIHRLEGVSSDEHVGSLAENLLEALCTNEAAASRIDEVRKQTRAEKKRLAMAMREKQLGALGIKANDKGQLRMESVIMNQMEELGEETGLVCVICREGYKYQPTKVLAVYTFTKRCNVDTTDNNKRFKIIGYSTVTHFNIVHVDCHMSAVRLARVRDEWESASLQNSNTKCNGLLPLWGPQVPESAFASCLARHNTYLQEATGHRDITYSLTVHDLKLLLLRFAQEKSFHEDSGGGGPQSNMHIIPYLVHMALYVINTTRCYAREVKSLQMFLDSEGFEWAYEAEGAHYWATFSVLLEPAAKWSAAARKTHLAKLVATAQLRTWFPSRLPPPNSTKPPHQYAHIKPSLIFFGLIDAIYKHFFKRVPFSSDDQWPVNLADYIRHNDEALMKASEKVMAFLTDELLPCTSFPEFCDVVGLLEEIPDPEDYLNQLLDSLL